MFYNICLPPNCAGSPTGAVFFSKLKEENRMAKQKIEHLEERLKIYEEANEELKKDFLLSRLRGAEDEAAVSEKPGTIPLSVMLFMQCDMLKEFKSLA